jgi:hypothetical protein
MKEWKRSKKETIISIEQRRNIFWNKLFELEKRHVRAVNFAFGLTLETKLNNNLAGSRVRLAVEGTNSFNFNFRGFKAMLVQIMVF